MGSIACRAGRQNGLHRLASACQYRAFTVSVCEATPERAVWPERVGQGSTVGYGPQPLWEAMSLSPYPATTHRLTHVTLPDSPPPRPPAAGRLTLSWVGKDQALLGTPEGGYEWVRAR